MQHSSEDRMSEWKTLAANWTKLAFDLLAAEQKCERIATLSRRRADAARQALDHARRSASAARPDLLRSLGVFAVSDPAAEQALQGVKALSPYPSATVARAIVDLLEEAQRACRPAPTSAAQAIDVPAEKDPAQGPPGELLTVKELEAWTQIDSKTIYGYVSKGLIPYVKIQSSARFRRKDIVAWLERQSFHPS